MARIYVSSTYEDLKEYRSAASGALRKMQHQATAMEDYGAADQRPLAKCLNDVAHSDIYIGIFAWRYGYVPKKGNPQKKSITELEYAKASECGIPRLIFLADKDYPWPPSRMDAITGEGEAGAAIRALRDAFAEELMVDYFTTPDNLAGSVSIAVGLSLSRQSVIRGLDLPSEITDMPVIRNFGSTLTPAIVDKIKEAMTFATGARIVEVDLGDGQTWWSTRLFLLAALLQDYTQISQMMFVEGDSKFIGMASPAAVRSGLMSAEPLLASAYAESKPGVGHWNRREDEVVALAQNFRMKLAALPKGEDEIKVWVTKEFVQRHLGGDLHKESTPLRHDMPAMLDSILSVDQTRAQPFIPLVRNGRTVEIIDREKILEETRTKILAIQADVTLNQVKTSNEMFKKWSDYLKE
jgi:hypothetical protein